MTSRQRFEAWALQESFYDLTRSNHGYYSLSTSSAWMAWQAAERDMLERAIALFSQPHVDHAGAEIVDKLKELLNEQH